MESWDLREQMDSEGTDGTEHRDLSGPLPLQLEQLSQNKTNTTVKQAFRQYKPLLELEGPVRELKFPPPPPTSHCEQALGLTLSLQRLSTDIQLFLPTQDC